MPSSRLIPELVSRAAGFNYRVFGLAIRSDIPLPELFEAESAGEADVSIRIGPVADKDCEPGLRVDGGALLLTIPEIARYRIQDGCEIIVEPEPLAPERNVRLFLLGSAFGALLHQRGLLPLHANAIEIDGKAVAFMGESGAGKSTLAAWFHDEGYRIIADDVCVVGFSDEGAAVAHPGLPRLRLWDEALEASGRSAADFPQSYIADDSSKKFDVAVGRAGAVERELPIGAAYLLERADKFEIQPLNGIEAAEAVFAHTYRGGFVSAAKSELSHWNACLRLVRAVPLFRLVRPWSLPDLGDHISAVLEHIRQECPDRVENGS